MVFHESGVTPRLRKRCGKKQKPGTFPPEKKKDTAPNVPSSTGAPGHRSEVSSFFLCVLTDIINDITDGLQFLRILLRHFHIELLFKRHHQLDRIEGIRAEIFNKRGSGRDLLSINAELFDDDIFDFLLDWFVGHK